MRISDWSSDVCSSDLEKDLQDAFGVSRPAIREAVKGLTAKGLLESRQGIGIRIRQLSDWNLFDRDVLGWVLDQSADPRLIGCLIEVRRLLEPTAAEFPSQRPPDADPPATAETAKRRGG